MEKKRISQGKQKGDDDDDDDGRGVDNDEE